MSSVPLGVQYLVGTLLILAVLAVIAAVWAAQRRMIGLSALLATPHALSALLVVPHYWKPPSILVVGIALEDVLFMAGVGGWAWVYAVLMVRNRITVSPCVKRGARRYLLILAGCGVAGAAIAGLRGVIACPRFSRSWRWWWLPGWRCVESSGRWRCTAVFSRV